MRDGVGLSRFKPGNGVSTASPNRAASRPARVVAAGTETALTQDRPDGELEAVECTRHAQACAAG